MWTHFITFLLDTFLKSLIIVMVTAVASVLLSRMSASVRNLVWVAAFACLALVPIASLVVPQTEVRGWPQVAQNAMPLRTQTQAALITVSAGNAGPAVGPNVKSAPSTPLASNATTVTATPAPVAVNYSYEFLKLLSVLWACGVVMLALRMASSYGRLAQLRAQGARVDDPAFDNLATGIGVRRPVVLLQGGPDTAGFSPVTWGWLRPHILLPHEATSWTRVRREAALAHELAHIARSDWALTCGCTIIASICWLNPLVWLALRRMVFESERACDNRVLAMGNSATEYASDLLEIARGVQYRNRASAVPMAHAGRMEGRLRSIISKSRNRGQVSARLAVIVGLVACGIGVAVAALSRVNHDLRHTLGRIQFDESSAQLREEESLLRTAIRQAPPNDPNLSQGYYVLGDLESNLGQWDLAVQDEKRSLMLPSKIALRPDAQRLLMEAYSGESKYGDAERAGEVLMAMPDADLVDSGVQEDIATYRRLDSLRLDGGKSDALRRYRAYERDVQLHKKFALPQPDLLALARDLADAKQTSQARACYSDWLAQYSALPNAGEVAIERAQLGNNMPTPQVVLAIMAKYPGGASNPDLQYDLGNAYYINDNVKALAAYRFAFEHGSANIAPVAGIGMLRILPEVGQVGERGAIANEIVRRFPNSPEAAQVIAAKNANQTTPAPAGTIFPSGWVFHAPGNVTLKLIKVTTGQNPACWKPDGTPLPKSADARNGLGRSSSPSFSVLVETTAPHTAYTLAGGLIPEVDIDAGLASSEGWSKTSPAPIRRGDTDVSQEWIGQETLLGLPDFVNLRLQLHAGNWTTIAVFNGPLNLNAVVKQGSIAIDLRGNAYRYGLQSQANSNWILLDDMSNVQKRVLVQPISGPPDVLSDSSTSSGNGHNATYYNRPNILLSKIKDIIVEVRHPIYVQFNNVRLKPNSLAGPINASVHK